MVEPSQLSSGNDVDQVDGLRPQRRGQVDRHVERALGMKKIDYLKAYKFSGHPLVENAGDFLRMMIEKG